jgi:hypothetical protein
VVTDGQTSIILALPSVTCYTASLASTLIGCLMWFGVGPMEVKPTVNQDKNLVKLKYKLWSSESHGLLHSFFILVG